MVTGEGAVTTSIRGKDPWLVALEGGSYLSLDFRDKLLPDKQYVLDWWQHYPGFLKSCMCADMLIVRV